jgi:hypothetical protein
MINCESMINTMALSNWLEARLRCLARSTPHQRYRPAPHAPHHHSTIPVALNQAAKKGGNLQEHRIASLPLQACRPSGGFALGSYLRPEPPSNGSKNPLSTECGQLCGNDVHCSLPLWRGCGHGFTKNRTASSCILMPRRVSFDLADFPLARGPRSQRIRRSHESLGRSLKARRPVLTQFRLGDPARRGLGPVEIRS